MRVIYGLLGVFFMYQTAVAQTAGEEQTFTRQACIDYAMKNQPLLKQTLVAEEIANKDVAIQLSDWLPQVSATANLQNNIDRQVSVIQIGDQEPQTLTMGTEYNSSVGLSVNQVIFNNDVLMAKQTASDYKEQAAQAVVETKISLVVNVSKSFYQVLATQQQVAIYDQTIERLEKSYADAKSRYETGIADKIDYKRAQISLNNAKAQRKGAVEANKAQLAQLKQLMGYPTDEEIDLVDDIENLEKEALLDTAYTPNYTDRIEYQLLQTQKGLAQANLSYYQNDFIPSLSAFYNHNWLYLDNNFSDLYQQSFPNSVLGLSVSLPIFQGTRRIRSIQKSKLEYKQLELQQENLERQINTEYVESLGSYKTNLEELQASRENFQIAQDVYETVKLQYDEGIKAYLELIVAESDLRTSQLNYLNALLNVLSSKLDVQRASGTINITPNN